jgi:hypothetical protein
MLKFVKNFLTGARYTHLGSMHDYQLMRVPPPYKKIIAINSDVEFTTWQAQLDIMKIFAERDLEVAFSFWLFGDPTWTWRILERDLSFSRHGAASLNLLRSGALDTIHSFGGILHCQGTFFDRNMIAQAYEILKSEGVFVKVYSNHGTSSDTQNIGGPWVGEPGTGPVYQLGDVPGHVRYHLDLSLRYGIRFFWVDIDRIRYRNCFVMQAGLDSTALFIAQQSRDGNRIIRFKRTDTGLDPDSYNLGKQIENVLGEDGEIAIIYNHLGVIRNQDGKPLGNRKPYFPQDVYDTLDSLAAIQSRGEVLVASTSRALNYALLIASQPWQLEYRDNDWNFVFADKLFVEGVNFSIAWEDLSGLCFKANTVRPPMAVLGGAKRRMSTWEIGGQRYVGFPWKRHNFSEQIENAAQNVTK